MTFPHRVPIQIIFACWVIFLLYWIARARSVKRTVEHHAPFFRFGITIVIIAALVVWAQLRVYGLVPHTSELWAYSTTIGVIADVIVIAGLALAIWARNVLGRNWSATVVFKENHQLIETGPYRYVRHPIYSALLLMFVGSVLVVGRAEWVAGFVAGIVLVGFKARMEEQLMTRHFPEEYPAYKRRVKGIIPFVV